MDNVVIAGKLFIPVVLIAISYRHGLALSSTSMRRKSRRSPSSYGCYHVRSIHRSYRWHRSVCDPLYCHSIILINQDDPCFCSASTVFNNQLGSSLAMYAPQVDPWPVRQSVSAIYDSVPADLRSGVIHSYVRSVSVASIFVSCTSR